MNIASAAIDLTTPFLAFATAFVILVIEKLEFTIAIRFLTVAFYNLTMTKLEFITAKLEVVVALTYFTIATGVFTIATRASSIAIINTALPYSENLCSSRL